MAEVIDRPDYASAAYEAQLPKWTLVDDVLGGTPAIWKAGVKYVPMASGEESEPEAYRVRLQRSRFYNLYRRTLRGLVGRVFRTAPKLAKDADPLLRAHAENIDGAGTALAVFLQRLMTRSIHYGHGAILVDCPPDPTSTLGRKPTLADEQALGHRPYWIQVDAKQIRSVRTVVVGGTTVLDQASIEEATLEPVGAFGESEVTRYRVLRRNGGVPDVTVYQITEKGDVVIESNAVYSRITEIPLVPYYVGEVLGPFHTSPTLYDVAELNLDHYNVQVGHRHNLHVTSHPRPYFAGLAPDVNAIEWNVTTGILLDKDGEAGFMESSGSGLTQSREELRDLEDRIAALGLQLLSRKSRTAETAEAKRIDNAEQESSLAVMVRGLQDAVEQAFTFHAKLAGVADPSMTVSFDFDGLSLDASEISTYLQLWQAGAFSLDTLWDMLEMGGKLPEDFDREQERKRLAEEAMALVPDRGDDAGDEPGDAEDERMAA